MTVSRRAILSGGALGLAIAELALGEPVAAASLDDYLSLSETGADPSGVKDSRAAIQAALYSGARDVLIPAGTFLITQDPARAWCLDVPAGIRLRGIGPSSVLRLARGQSEWARMLHVAGDETRLEDFALDGNESAQPRTDQGHSVFASGAGVRIERLVIRASAGDGVYLYNGSRRSSVIGCDVSGIRRVGVNAAGADDSLVAFNMLHDFPNYALKMEADNAIPRRGNTFAANVATNVAGGISISGTGARISDVAIVANRFHLAPGADGIAVALRTVEHITVLGNRARGGAFHAIALDSDCDDVALEGNAIAELADAPGDAYAILVGSGGLGPCSGIRIVGNDIRGTPGGIGILPTAGGDRRNSLLVISGNTIRDTTRLPGLTIADADDVQVSGGIFANCATAAILFTPVIVGSSRVAIGGCIFRGSATQRYGILNGPWNALTLSSIVGNVFASHVTSIHNVGTFDRVTIGPNTQDGP